MAGSSLSVTRGSTSPRPVLYVGVVQAALCDKLGASATIANLPASTYMLGQIAPLVFCWLVPHRLERSVVVWANLMTGLVILLVAVALALPLPAGLQIAAVVNQGLLQGLSASTSQVFMLQCLRRGTTPERACPGAEAGLQHHARVPLPVPWARSIC